MTASLPQAPRPLFALADEAAARAYLAQFVPMPGQGAPPSVALARSLALMAALGNPQDAVPVIHLAGTSGKGSTAVMIAALLQAHGLEVGLGLSPHVRHLRERIQVNGAWISAAEFARAVATLAPATLAPAVEEATARSWGAPTFFEIMIALSYAFFADRGVDVVVMETGLGGRYDATNVVAARDKFAVITPIGYDHMDVLGDTLAEIATAKAGIIRPGNCVLCAPQTPEAAAVIAATCAREQASLHLLPKAAVCNVRPDPTGVTFDLALSAQGAPPLGVCDLRVALAGAHQADNAALALFAAQHWLGSRGVALDAASARAALDAVRFPGRMETLVWRGATVILDGAHNAQKMAALVIALTTIYPGDRFTVVLALKAGKDAGAILAELRPITARLIVTRFVNEDQGMPLTAADPTDLAALARAQGFSQVEVAPDPAAALVAAVISPVAAPVLVTGSLYLLPEVYAALEGAPADDAASAEGG